MSATFHHYGGRYIAEVLKTHGIDALFTLCGGHISPILVGCKKEGLKVIDVRDEATAVFAADAYARLSGKPGVAAVTAGPGVTNSITAIKNAQMAHSSVIILGGATATFLKNRGSLQDIDQISLVQSTVKKAYTVKTVRDIVPTLNEALYLSQKDVPGPVFVELPLDILYPEPLIRREYEKAKIKNPTRLTEKFINWYVERHVKNLFKTPKKTHSDKKHKHFTWKIPERLIQKVTELIKSSQRPVMLISSGAMHIPQLVAEMQTAISALGIPVYLSGMARGLLGKSHTLQFRHKRRDALKEADLVIILGQGLDFRLDYGRSINRKAKLVMIHRDKKEIGKNRRPTIGSASDPALFLIKLAKTMKMEHGESNWEDWFKRLKERETKREKEIEGFAKQKTEYINPLYLCQQIDSAIGDNSVIVADGGDFVATASYIVRPRAPLSWLDPGVFGTLGSGAGFALGTSVVRPQSEIWVLYGDGAFGYSIAEFDTFVRFKIPVIGVIGNDASWQQIARGQIEMFQDDVGTKLRYANYEQVIEGFGAKGFLLEDSADTYDILLEAKKIALSGVPVLINALIGKTDFRKGSLSM